MTARYAVENPLPEGDRARFSLSSDKRGKKK